MTVPARSKSCVFGAASRVLLHGDACPMVDAVAEPDVDRLSHEDDAGLSRAFGDRRDTGQTSQSVVISPLQGIGCFVSIRRGPRRSWVRWRD